MFGKPFQTFNIIHACIGFITILSVTKVCSDNIRYKTGIWSIDPQAFYMYNQPSTFRKLYWYNTRAPHFTTRKQRMVNMQLKYGYRNAPPEIGASYGNPTYRSTFKNTYDDGSLSSNILRTYMTSVRIPSTSVPKTPAPSLPYFETKQHVYKNTTICKQNKNITLAPEVKESVNILPHFRGLESISNGINVLPNYRGFESISNSISNTIPPMIEPPFQPYITHSYFTLDDVIVPNSPKNFHFKSKHSDEKKIPYDSQPQDSFITQKTTHFKDKAVRISSTATSSSTTTIEPIRTTEAIQQTTMEFQPTTILPEAETTKEVLRHFTTLSPTVTTDKPNTIISNKKSIIREIFNGFAINRTPTTIIPNTIFDKKNWSSKKHIPFRKNLMPITFNDDFCYSCGKNSPNMDNITLSDVKPDLNITQFKDKHNSTLISKKSEGRKKLSLKTLATKLKAAQNKTLPLAKYQSAPNISSTTEMVPIRNRRNKTSFIHMRRRKLEANATRFKAYNVSRNNSMNSKILKPKTELKTPILNVTNEQVIVREAIKINTVTNNTILATTTSSSITETTASAAESAIMTISNTNGRSLRRSMRKFRKHTPVADVAVKPIDLLHSTDLPKLPIEVYFTKLNNN